MTELEIRTSEIKRERERERRRNIKKTEKVAFEQWCPTTVCFRDLGKLNLPMVVQF